MDGEQLDWCVVKLMCIMGTQVALKAIKVSLSLYRIASRKSLPKLPSETSDATGSSPTQQLEQNSSSDESTFD